MVPTQAAAFHPANDPNTSHTCSGTSVARALEVATGGLWTGSYSTTRDDYTVDSILDENHSVSGPGGSLWSFWVNDAPPKAGICQQLLNPGDQIVFFPTGAVPPAVLGISAPSAVAGGTPFTAGVVAYPGTGGSPTPLAGATLKADGVSAVTTTGGQATLTLVTPGSYILTATAPGAVRVESLICVHDGDDGYCGTPVSPTPPAPAPVTSTGTVAPPVPCATNGADGLCGTVDTTPPIARLQIPEGRHYGHGKGPLRLIGTVSPDPSGIRVIRLRLTRQYHGRCQDYTAAAGLVTGSCAIDDAPWFTVGPPTPFSYLLRKRLPSGRYILDIQAVDGAGNVQAVQVPGRSRIVFRVE
jgi:hypothetical protein